MNISKNEVDALNLLVNIEITPEDYQTKVSDVLENYRKRANIPGFRPGKVPMGLIKKQYGKAVLIEEINNLLQDNIYKYITGNSWVIKIRNYFQRNIIEWIVEMQWWTNLW